MSYIKTLSFVYISILSSNPFPGLQDFPLNNTCFFFISWLDSRSGPRPPRRSFEITLRHTTLGRTPLDEWSARHRDLYLTTQNTHKRQTSMPPAGFEPAIPASERPQTHAVDRAATGIGLIFSLGWIYYRSCQEILRFYRIVIYWHTCFGPIHFRQIRIFTQSHCWTMFWYSLVNCNTSHPIRIKIQVKLSLRTP